LLAKKNLSVTSFTAAEAAKNCLSYIVTATETEKIVSVASLTLLSMQHPRFAEVTGVTATEAAATGAASKGEAAATTTAPTGGATTAAEAM
jgi:hypothetical protein